ncbi:putative acetyl-CoA C-acyltransferase [Rosa chinensis]|uniref:Putative acetyl-CoA C-acyltransferase n=1 Tax=Rosa chinensis TaxID=74649 RepID=A0A2P6QWL3_ROSCH|nr:putative acetyl-CoA C-acyltransferase [Rosa chinensis]
MGVTLENVAYHFGVSRQEQDQVAVDSHRKAAADIYVDIFLRCGRDVSLISLEDVTGEGFDICHAAGSAQHGS